MNFVSAAILGFILSILVDILGAMFCKKFRFHYGYLTIVSAAFALSPLLLTGDETSKAQAAFLSLIVYWPETAFGLFFAYIINPYCGSSDNYAEQVRKFGFMYSYATCWILWLILAGIVYLLK